MSQIRKESAKLRPSKPTPSSSRSRRPRAPPHATAYRASTVTGRGVAAQDHAVRRLVEAGDLMAPALLDQGLRGDGLVEDLLGAGLRDVDEGRERDRPESCRSMQKSLVLPVEGAGARPGETLLGDPTTAAGGPDVEDIALLADRLAAHEVAFRPLVEEHDGNAPSGEQQGGGLADRPVADDRDAIRRSGRRARSARQVRSAWPTRPVGPVIAARS